MRIAIIADTHSRSLPAACVERLCAADLIVHAGDCASAAAFDELERLGPPVIAVHGNQDDARLRSLLPAARVMDADGASIGLLPHDAGPAKGRLARMRRRFPDCEAVVFGHSHIPLHETADDGFQIYNPGSPTERRRAPHVTMGIAEIRDGRVELKLLTLG